ncbi:lysophospholipid acyltransferase family protein [Myxococcota bacterium]
MTWIARLGSVLIAFLIGSLLRVRRAHVVQSMTIARIPEPERTATRMYRSLARGLLELLSMVLTPHRRLGVRLTDPQVRRWLSVPTGAVVATSHTGNWDVVACAVAELAPLTVVTKRLSVGWLDRLWQRLRAKRGVHLVEARGAWGHCRAALRRGELVAMLVDQAPERSEGVLWTAFLGQMASVDLAPALLAMRARVPLVAAFPCRTADGILTIELGPVLLPPQRSCRVWPVQAMREVTQALEAFVRRHPQQWLWMHRRWKVWKGGQPADRRFSPEHEG